MSLRILEIVFPIFAIVLVGLIYARLKRPDMSLPNLLNMQVFIPALLFTVITQQMQEAGAYLGLMVGAILVVLIPGLISVPVAKLIKVDVKTLCPPMMFGNAGNLGLPLIVMAFGEAAFPTAVVVFLVGNFLHITLGSYLLDHKAPIIKVLMSPMIIAVVLAFFLSFMHIELPKSVLLPVEMLGQICVPLMLFALGVRLAHVDLSDWKLGLFCAVLAPVTGILAVVLVMWLFSPWFALTPTQQGALFLFGALPPAVMNFMFAEHYDQEPQRVASIVLIGNAFALISIPVALVYALPQYGS